EPAGFFVGTQALFAGKFAVEFESALDCEAIGKRCVLVPDIKLHGIILAVKGSNRLLQRRVDAKIRIPADFGRNIPRGVDGPGFRNFNIEQICLRVLLSMGRPYHGNVATVIVPATTSAVDSRVDLIVIWLSLLEVVEQNLARNSYFAKDTPSSRTCRKHD